jgi:hypothetical protein
MHSQNPDAGACRGEFPDHRMSIHGLAMSWPVDFSIVGELKEFPPRPKVSLRMYF